MGDYNLDRTRKKIAWAMAGLCAAGAAWVASPGLPVFRAPYARPEVKLAGLALFEHEWQPHDPMARGDGLGPVFNAKSCVACHFQGGVGGGGDNKHNVLAFQAHPTQDRPEVKGGLVHKFAVENRFFEKTSELSKFFPVIPGGIRVESGCSVLTLDFDPIHTESVNSTALFGAGWLDRISSKSIRHESMKTTVAKIGRELDSDFGGVVLGRPRILPDGRLGKFGWKAEFATLEAVVAAGCANEIGLGNPMMPQAKPLVRSGYPDVEPDLDRDQFRSLVAFIDTLERPVEITPESPGEQEEAARGKEMFAKVGCAACHTPDMGGVAGVYTDFLLHRLDDRSLPGGGGGGYGSRNATPPVPLPEAFPLEEEWKTPALWGVADSAPYFHDGGSPTLESAILRHMGDAEQITRAYKHLPASDRQAVIAFLKTLKAPVEAKPAPLPSKTTLAQASGVEKVR